MAIALAEIEGSALIASASGVARRGRRALPLLIVRVRHAFLPIREQAVHGDALVARLGARHVQPQGDRGDRRPGGHRRGDVEGHDRAAQPALATYW
jgi:hypothetical protein